MKFRTKARAVELLGKGQIADLPTAITELWKNGYDAYADNLTAEIFLSGYKGLEHPYFMISDDGVGMSRDDIINKWLVLGIDSKSRSDKQDKEGEDTLYTNINNLEISILLKTLIINNRIKEIYIRRIYL